MITIDRCALPLSSPLRPRAPLAVAFASQAVWTPKI